MIQQVDTLINGIDRLPEAMAFGRVVNVVGLQLEASGLAGLVSVGEHVHVVSRDGRRVAGEVVGVTDGRVRVMPFGAMDGFGHGCRVEAGAAQPVIHPDDGWLGRVVDAFGTPIDDKGPIPVGRVPRSLNAAPPQPHRRQRVGDKLDLGVRAINAFLTCCRGQRMGIFSASGVGKSTLLAMMASHTDAEVCVVGLIGERGREAREFIEDDLGAAGLARSVVVVATSDQPPLVRRQAAHTMMAVAEHFRDQGRHVLCLMDSVTRFAMAQREIGLSAGEPPASKGYTPSVFAALPRLLERAGPGGPDQGSITGLFTVLVEGDDHNEPVTDAVRGILDGHVVLDRSIAERGRYPPVNVLRSISRSMPRCNSDDENTLVERARRLMSAYEDMAELIRLGAYRHGSDPQVDEAIHHRPAIEAFLAQQKGERTSLEDVYAMLAQAIGAPATSAEPSVGG